VIHSRLTATSALRDGRNDKYVVSSVLHDICDGLGSYHPSDVTAAMAGRRRKVRKRLHYLLAVMSVCARRYAADLLCFRQRQEMMHERGDFVDHSTVRRWAPKVLSM
jgi:predicted HD phosphohydrolase